MKTLFKNMREAVKKNDYWKLAFWILFTLSFFIAVYCLAQFAFKDVPEGWLSQSITSLKIWHLIVILWVIGIVLQPSDSK
jgi:predicted membrane protein